MTANVPSAIGAPFRIPCLAPVRLRLAPPYSRSYPRSRDTLPDMRTFRDPAGKCRDPWDLLGLEARGQPKLTSCDRAPPPPRPRRSSRSTAAPSAPRRPAARAAPAVSGTRSAERSASVKPPAPGAPASRCSHGAAPATAHEHRRALSRKPPPRGGLARQPPRRSRSTSATSSSRSTCGKRSTTSAEWSASS